jgi:hypothetical protein
MNFWQHLQNLWLSRAIGESTWGYPIVGAVHVLATAFFGGALLAANAQLRTWRWLTGSILILSGLLLFLSNAGRYSNSISFRLKLLLLLLLPFTHRNRYLTLFLFAAVIFAARGIAFF